MMNKRRTWLIAFLLSITITSMAIQYLGSGSVEVRQVMTLAVGAVIGWLLIHRIDDRGLAEPQIDERHQYHTLLSGYRAFLLLNLLIIGSLLQPWISHGNFGLWVGILVVGLIFWVANLLILGRRA